MPTDRALGALYGLAIGDALGMPTQELDSPTAKRILGTPPGFRDGPAENVRKQEAWTAASSILNSR